VGVRPARRAAANSRRGGPRLIRGIEQIAIHAGEIAVDAFFEDDTLDGVDGRGLTFGRQSGAVLAMQPFQFAKPVVEHGGEMRGRSFGFTRDNRAVVQNNHGLPAFVSRYAVVRPAIRRRRGRHRRTRFSRAAGIRAAWPRPSKRKWNHRRGLPWALFAKKLRDDENHGGAGEATAAKEIEQRKPMAAMGRITGRRVFMVGSGSVDYF